MVLFPSEDSVDCFDWVALVSGFLGSDPSAVGGGSAHVAGHCASVGLVSPASEARVMLAWAAGAPAMSAVIVDGDVPSVVGGSRSGCPEGQPEPSVVGVGVLPTNPHTFSSVASSPLVGAHSDVGQSPYDGC